MSLESFQTAEDALNFAISEEEGAVVFYTELASRATEKAIRELLLEFAEEERGHMQKLLDIKAGQQMLVVDEKVSDLKIADYLTDVQPRPDVTYQDALIIAMKKESSQDASDLRPDVPNSHPVNGFENGHLLIHYLILVLGKITGADIMAGLQRTGMIKFSHQNFR